MSLSGLPCPAVEEKSFSNGLRLVVHPFKSPGIGISLILKCGSIYENNRNSGVSHFLEHMIFRGSVDYPSAEALGFALDRVGTDVNAATFSDMTMYSMRVLPEHLDPALALLKQIITAPLMSDIEVERRIILEECLEDYDEEGRMTAVDQLSSQQIFPSHPYSYPIIGNADTIRAMSVETLKGHLRRFYRPDRAVISISGASDTDQAVSRVKKAFGTWQNPVEPFEENTVLKTMPVFHGPTVNVVRTPRSQIHCRLSFKTLSFADPDYYVEKVIARILDSSSGSPLRKAMQEQQGYCYSLGAESDSYETAGAIHIDFAVCSGGLIEAIESSANVMKTFADSPPEVKIVEQAVFQYGREKRLNIFDLWDYSSGRAFHTLYPVDTTPEQEYKKVVEITPEQIHTVARQLFKPENLNLLLVGPVSLTEERKARAIISHWQA